MKKGGTAICPGREIGEPQLFLPAGQVRTLDAGLMAEAEWELVNKFSGHGIFCRPSYGAVIAQRVSSVMGMDKILVMDNGKCVGYGNHEELGPLGIARLNRTDGLPRKAWPHQVPHIAGDGAQ